MTRPPAAQPNPYPRPGWLRPRLTAAPQRQRDDMEPARGLEPLTARLQVECAASCATPAMSTKRSLPDPATTPLHAHWPSTRTPRAGHAAMHCLLAVEEGAEVTAQDPNAVPTQLFDWGRIKWFISKDQTPGANLTFGQVILLPGKGHDRHNHPDAEEVLYVLSGRGEQMVNDEKPFSIAPGDTIYVPQSVYHSTVNTGWEPLQLLAIYNPAGAEHALTQLPDFREAPAGELPGLANT